MNWQEYIHTDPKVLVGKPVLKGTRLSVGFVLRLLASGWTREQIMANYPRLTPEMLQACFSFAAECLEENPFTPRPPNEPCAFWPTRIFPPPASSFSGNPATTCFTLLNISPAWTMQ